MTESRIPPDGPEESSLITLDELRNRVSDEGIDPDLVCVAAPRWAESAPRSEDSLSALVRSDLIVRSDGSLVLLDGMMGADSLALANQYLHGESNPQGLPWQEWILGVIDL